MCNYDSKNQTEPSKIILKGGQYFQSRVITLLHKYYGSVEKWFPRKGFGGFYGSGTKYNFMLLQKQ